MVWDMFASPDRNGFSKIASALAADAAGAFDARGQVADQQFGADGAGPQLGMGEVEVVLPLHHVVGEFVGQREADPERRAVRADDVEAGDLRLLAAVQREGGRGQRAPGATRAWPVPL